MAQLTVIRSEELNAVPMQTDQSAAWRTVRSWGDVFRDEDGVWYLTGTDVIAEAARAPGIFSSQLAYGRFNYPIPQIPVAVDPPDHSRFRRALEPLFSAGAVRAVEADLRRQAALTTRALGDRRRCDVVADIALRFPTRAFVSFFGMPIEDVDQLTSWVHTILDHTPIGDAEETAAHARATADLFAYITSFLGAKRDALADDVLSRLLSFDGDDRWSDEELLGLMFVMMTAGLDTVTRAIGHLFYQLAIAPGLRARVIEDERALAAAIEEVLRTNTVAPFIPRVTTADTQVAGHLIPARSTVLLVYGAANRDPERYPNADEIDVNRATRGHYAFGLGIHRCLGSHLARIELKVLVQEFHRAFTRYHLAPQWTPDLEWPASMLGLRSLPVVLQ